MGKRASKRKIKAAPSIEGSGMGDWTVDLKEELEEGEKRFSHGSLNFIPLNFIANLFKAGDHSKLRLSLEHDLQTISTEGDDWQVEGLTVKRNIDDWKLGDNSIDELEEYVRTQASKLYAVLLLIQQSQVIIPLYKQEHRVADIIFEKSKSEGDEAYCLLEWLKTQEHLKRLADNFYDAQWRIPPRLSGDTVPTFPATFFRFPYLGRCDSIAGGAGGVVYKVKVAKGHLKVDGYIEVGKQRDLKLVALLIVY
jgi:hypothetical protein